MSKERLLKLHVLVCVIVWTVLLSAFYYCHLAESIDLVGVITLFLGYVGWIFSIALWWRNIILTEKIRDMEGVEAELRYYSYYDAMVGINNRNAFVQEAKLFDGETSGFAVILCDIDGLKLINDHLGHSVGDELLRITAEILRENSAGGRVYRLGGDEFLVLFSQDVTEEELMAVVNQIQQSVNYRSQRHLPLSISVGWSLADNMHTLHELIRIADCRMYKDKAERREQFRKDLINSFPHLSSNDKLC